jgi:hypothetical protein
MARKFIGANSSAFQISNGILPSIYPYTLASYINTTNPALAGNQTAICISQVAGANNIIYLVVVTADSKFYLANVDHTGGFFVTPVGSALSANTWYACANVGVSATNRTGYIAPLGGPISSANDTTSCVINNIDTTSLGLFESSFTPEAFWDGALSNQAIWNVALTLQEFTDYKNGKPAYLIRPQNLLACWMFQDQMSLALDSGPHSRNAAATGTIIPQATVDPPLLQRPQSSIRKIIWSKVTAAGGATIVPWPFMRGLRVH